MLSFGESKDRASERVGSKSGNEPRGNGSAAGSWSRIDRPIGFQCSAASSASDESDNLLIDWMNIQIARGDWSGFLGYFQVLVGVEKEIGLGALEAARTPGLTKRFGFALLTDCARSYGLTPGELAGLLDDPPATVREAVRHLVFNAINELEAQDLIPGAADRIPQPEAAGVSDADAEFDDLVQDWRCDERADQA